MVDTSRSEDVVSEEFQSLSVAVIGVGAIGSNVVHVLASMGITNITVFDRDRLETPNVSPAFFSSAKIGLPKTEALAADIQERFGISITTKEFFVTPDVQLDEYDVVVVGPDTMSARSEIWMAAEGKWKLWIDAAMGGVRGQVYSLRKEDNHTVYCQTLGRPDTPLPCGAKAFPPVSKGLLPWLVSVSIWRWSRGLAPLIATYNADHGYLSITDADRSGYGTFAYAMTGDYESSDGLD